MVNRIKDRKLPKSVLLVLISSLDYDSLLSEASFQEFFSDITENDKSGRLYKINLQNKNEISNLFSYFTGSRSEINGIKGNLLDNVNKLGYFDSVFRRLKKNQIPSSIIGI